MNSFTTKLARTKALWRNGLPLLVIFCSTSLANNAVVEISDVQVTLITEVHVDVQEAGRIQALLVQPGDVVVKGTPMVQLDDRLLRLQSEAAELQAKLAEIPCRNDVDRRFAAKSLEVAQAEVARSEELNRAVPRAVSLSDLDQQRLILERSSLAAEKAKWDLGANLVTWHLRRKELELLQSRLSLMRIDAPLSGMVVEIAAQPGEWVNTGDHVARLIQLDRLRVEAFVDGMRLGPSLLGAPVELCVSLPPHGEKRVFAGHITFVSPEVSPINSETRIWADIANSDMQLRPGIRGSMTIRTNEICPREQEQMTQESNTDGGPSLSSQFSRH